MKEVNVTATKLERGENKASRKQKVGQLQQSEVMKITSSTWKCLLRCFFLLSLFRIVYFFFFLSSFEYDKVAWTFCAKCCLVTVGWTAKHRGEQSSPSTRRKVGVAFVSWWNWSRLAAATRKLPNWRSVLHNLTRSNCRSICYPNPLFHLWSIDLHSTSSIHNFQMLQYFKYSYSLKGIAAHTFFPQHFVLLVVMRYPPTFY